MRTMHIHERTLYYQTIEFRTRRFFLRVHNLRCRLCSIVWMDENLGEFVALLCCRPSLVCVRVCVFFLFLFLPLRPVLEVDDGRDLPTKPPTRKAKREGETKLNYLSNLRRQGADLLLDKPIHPLPPIHFEGTRVEALKERER